MKDTNFKVSIIFSAHQILNYGPNEEPEAKEPEPPAIAKNKVWAWMKYEYKNECQSEGVYW